MQGEENWATTESDPHGPHSGGGAVSKTDEHFVTLYRTAGEILWWLHVRALCVVELSVVSQSFYLSLLTATGGWTRDHMETPIGLFRTGSVSFSLYGAAVGRSYSTKVE